MGLGSQNGWHSNNQYSEDHGGQNGNHLLINGAHSASRTAPARLFSPNCETGNENDAPQSSLLIKVPY